MSKKKKNRRLAKPSPELQAIWDKVPKMADCKGMCQASCGPIPAYGDERKLVEGRAGKELKTVGNLRCSMLTASGVCSVYGIRPLICRLWGAVDHPAMKCPHGCVPERWLTNPEAMELFAELEALTGDSEGSGAVDAMLAALTPVEKAAFDVQAAGLAKGSKRG